MKLPLKHIIGSLTTITCAIAVVTLLAWKTMKPINQKNGFTRSIQNSNLPILNIINSEEVITGIADITANHLYFKLKDPSKLYVTDYNLRGGHYIQLKIPRSDKLISGTHYFIDSSNVNMLSGRLPAVIITGTDTLSDLIKFPSKQFTRVARIGPTSYIFRGFDTTIKTIDQIFLKGDPFTRSIQRENNVTNKRGDAGISTDGLLHYDTKTNLIIYTHFYKSLFFCLDTNLNLVYKANTIDTLSSDSSWAGRSKSNQKNVFNYTNTAPKRLHNYESCVAFGKLYNQSKLKADNEDNTVSSNNATIDIYNVKDGKYQGSIYIPHYKDEKIKQFRVLTDRIVVQYKTSIVTYKYNAS